MKHDLIFWLNRAVMLYWRSVDDEIFFDAFAKAIEVEIIEPEDFPFQIFYESDNSNRLFDTQN